MVLADTSIWIEHFRTGRVRLAELLNRGVILTHPFILGELACGNLRDRASVLGDLGTLPAAVSATHEEVLEFLGEHRIWGKGIGWVDAHLVASVLLTGCSFWTLDAKLEQVASAAGLKLHVTS